MWKAGKSLVTLSVKHQAGKEFNFWCKNLREVWEGGLNVGVASMISTVRWEEQPRRAWGGGIRSRWMERGPPIWREKDGFETV